MLWLCFTVLVLKTVLSGEVQNSIRYDNAKVLQMLLNCGGNVASLRNDLEDMAQKLNRLRIKRPKETYTRWGRSSCPTGATTVYDGFTAGSHYSHGGGAANHICLSKEPKYDFRTNKARTPTYIYGAEYETRDSFWDSLVDHDIPCAVCQITRTSVIMVPGRDDCPENFKLEYGGYLMAGHYKHASATEYLCFDANPTATEYSSPLNHDGALFYLVQAGCGSLKCQPYIAGKFITCAVCSYSP